MNSESTPSSASSAELFARLASRNCAENLTLSAKFRLAISLTLLLAAGLGGLFCWGTSLFSGGFAYMAWWPMLFSVGLCPALFLLPDPGGGEQYCTYYRQKWHNSRIASGSGSRSLWSIFGGSCHWDGLPVSLPQLRFWGAAMLDTSPFWYFLFMPLSAASRFAPYFYANVILFAASAFTVLFMLHRYLLTLCPEGGSAWLVNLSRIAGRLSGAIIALEYVMLLFILGRSGISTPAEALQMLFVTVPEMMVTLFDQGEVFILSFALMLFSFAWLGTMGAAALILRQLATAVSTGKVAEQQDSNS